MIIFKYIPGIFSGLIGLCVGYFIFPESEDNFLPSESGNTNAFTTRGRNLDNSKSLESRIDSVSSRKEAELNSYPVTVELLTKLMENDPAILERLQLDIFDDFLNPNSAKADLLGLDSSQLQYLADETKNISALVFSNDVVSLSKSEEKNKYIFEFVSASPEVRELLNQQLVDRFSEVFPRELSQGLVKKLALDHPFTLGGLNGQDRTVRIDQINGEYLITTTMGKKDSLFKIAAKTFITNDLPPELASFLK
ncbi:hypothetical protein V2O64_25095 (plasmid) [Verrucomicrobiaceae bacterium 227]